MCGIAGILQGSGGLPVERATLARMCDSLAHRGPDEHGIHLDGPCGLGHRRLSIIDLSSGQQPMLNDDGSVAISYNGEVYNFQAVRQALEARGVRFRTQSDTEVILRAYEAYGEDCPKHLRGMFAFAIWDRNRGKLLLARDRVGIKPVYWALAGGALVFGSELKAVMRSGRAGTEIDPQALDDFFAYSYIRAPRSIFAGVSKLRPGTILVATLAPGAAQPTVEERPFWSLPDWPDGRPKGISYEDAKSELLRLLDEAVRIRLISEVPLGAFLSGGLDSSTVVWLMAKNQPEPVHTFSIGFEHDAFDERPHARAVAQHFGTRHEEEVVTADSAALLPELMAAHDEPFGDPSSIPTWYVCRMARKHVTVALGGDGGDELFAGYTRYPMIQRELGRTRWLPMWARRGLALGGRPLPLESRTRNVLERIAYDPEAQYARFRAIFSPAMRQRLLRAEVSRRVDFEATGQVFRDLPPGMRRADPLTRVQAADFLTYLPEDVLTKVDRMSMAHALEARVPLLDHHVVEHVMRLPPEFKHDGRRSKRILRDLIEPHMPPGLLSRRKQGFSVPLRAWLGGQLAGRMREAVESRTYAGSGLFDPGYVRRVYERHQSGKQDLSWALWQILVFHVWYEQTRPGLSGV